MPTIGSIAGTPKAKKGTLFGKPRGEVIKRPGALHKALGVPKGENIPAKKLAKAVKAPGRLGKEARLAKTMKGWK